LSPPVPFAQLTVTVTPPVSWSIRASQLRGPDLWEVLMLPSTEAKLPATGMNPRGHRAVASPSPFLVTLSIFAAVAIAAARAAFHAFI
jgi:hypothetical protein